MALTTRANRPVWHFWVRFAGLTGVFLLVVGLGVLAADRKWLGIGLSAGGAALTALTILALAFEMGGLRGQGTSGRGAVGSVVLLQTLLAAALLAGVNVFSFLHYARLDWTRDRQFTIPADLREQLSRLRGETKIVVYLPHVSFGQQGDKQGTKQTKKQDNYDAAAERKIVEKVKDLAEQFQELGPRFRVEVLDIQEEGFAEKMADLKKQAPELAAAIDAAPENSIFFHADGKVQRLSFHDVYQLDKVASKEANDGRGNLVLRFQGAEPFARKVLNIDEKRPRVAVAVVHEVLGLDNTDEWNQALGMTGARTALANYGIDARDVILKKWNDVGPPEPAVLTRDESKYEELDEQLKDLEANVQAAEKEYEVASRRYQLFKSGTLEEVNKEYILVSVDDELVLIDQQRFKAEVKRIGRRPPTQPVTEDQRKHFLPIFERESVKAELTLGQERKDRDEVARQKKGLNVENIAELRHITDLHAKFNRSLADCDLLIVPRMTLANVVKGQVIPNRVYRLDDAQISAIKDFMKSGKPVLFCLGPTNEAAGRFDPAEASPDALEGLLTDLGFRLPKQTVLFNSEVKSFGQRRSGLVIFDSAEKVELPPAQFDWPAGAGQPGRLGSLTERDPHPIRTSVRITGRSIGQDELLELKLRHPRPVYFAPKGERAVPEAVFMMTAAESWNENQPFPTRERTPRYEEPKESDPTRGTVEEKRHGPFPIGVAAEVQLPESWFDDKGARAPKVRVAVIGHGGVFTGKSLSPTQEKLLLDVSNWLMGRDDLLAKDKQTWQYPRVDLSPSTKRLWQWGTWLGLPALFVYLGLVVLMVRRMR